MTYKLKDKLQGCILYIYIRGFKVQKKRYDVYTQEKERGRVQEYARVLNPKP